MNGPRVSPGLLEADARCLLAAERLLDTIGEWPSPVGHERFREALDAARREADRAEAAGEADPLLLRHLRAGWDTLAAVVRYRWEWPRVPEEAVLEALGGPETVEVLSRAVAGADRELLWDYLGARHRQREGRIPPSAPAARPRVEAAARRLAEEFRAWLAGRGWRLPGLDVEVTVDPGDRAMSSYRPGRRLVVLGGAEFLVFAGEDGPRVDPTIALLSLAHELAGHAVQAALSRELPAPLRPDDRARLRFASLPVAEGFAGHAGRLAPAFAREAGEEVGIGPDEMAFLSRMVELTPIHHATAALVDLAVLRARREPGFDPAAWLAERCGHGGFGEVVAGSGDVPLYKLLYDAGSFLGLRTVAAAAAELSRRGIEGEAAWRRLGTGAWALPCYRDAVLGEDGRR